MWYVCTRPHGSVTLVDPPPLPYAQSEIERLKRLLEEEKDGRMAEVTDLERRSVAAKERLKTEMFNKIKETKKVRR